MAQWLWQLAVMLDVMGSRPVVLKRFSILCCFFVGYVESQICTVAIAIDYIFTSEVQSISIV